MQVSNAEDYPPAVLQPLIEYFSPDKLIQLAEERFCLVAVRDSVVVGTIALEGNSIVTFFVHPDFQRCGIGSRLLVTLEARARNDGISGLRVASSLTGEAFYGSKGFVATGEKLDGSGGVQVVLSKRL